MKGATRTLARGGSSIGNFPLSCCGAAHAPPKAMARMGLGPHPQPNNPSSFYRACRTWRVAWSGSRSRIERSMFGNGVPIVETHRRQCIRWPNANDCRTPGNALFQEEEGQMIAPCRQVGGGKSGLRRAGCWITSSGGDPKESATENKPPGTRMVWLVSVRCSLARVKRCGKSAPIPVATPGFGKPHPVQDQIGRRSLLRFARAGWVEVGDRLLA